MQSFLQKTVKLLHEKYGDGISELCIVLPNRRAGLFLKTHFSKAINKTFWAPEIYAIEDFISLLSEHESVDTTTLLFELYETVKSVNTANNETFDEFSKWGQIFLTDINEIDRYLVDAKQLFGNLKDIKELETWSLNREEELSDFQKQYVKFWQLLGEYYFDFRKRLLNKHQSYQGLEYRIVAENLDEKINKHQWKKIIFAGFNALNKAEEIIFEKLLNDGKAELIWDTDSYYVNDVKQEAGKFIRKYRDKHFFSKSETAEKSNKIIDDNLFVSNEKTITIVGGVKNIAQAKLAGKLVQDLEQKNSDLQNTALVLADESLLFPVLHSLPSNLNDINVTMGYPLKSTPAAGYFDLIFNLHLNAQNLSKNTANYSFYHKDLLNLLNHPFTTLLLYTNEERFLIKSITKIIHERNILFASATTLEKYFTAENNDAFELLKPVLNHWKSPEDAISCANYVIDTLKNGIISRQINNTNNTASLELEYLFAFTKILKRVQALMNNYPDSVIDIKSFYNVLKQIVNTTTLPFYGEPLMGLQVMGMLETRTLDFENIILLSCNENILPSGKTGNSFIPYELKSYFGLPTYNDKDAIFAYHFYRLLQRAKNIYLVYNTESDVLGSGEKSRFLTQLIYELPKVNKQIILKEELFSVPVEVKNQGNEISIKKSAEIIATLNAKAEYGLSPSLLNRYVNCSLQFYFQSIAGLKEVDEVEETIAAETLGTVIHEALETLYNPFVGKQIKADDVKEMKKQVKAITDKGFEKHYNAKEILYGKNLLTAKVAIKFIANFLDSEIDLIENSEKQGKPLIIKKLEEKLTAEIKINNQVVKFSGIADRIDSLGSITRFIDYKTGKAEDKELKIEEWELLQTDPNFAKSFQLLMYAWMYNKMNPAINDNMISGIITFRELSKGLKTVSINKNNMLDVSVLSAFEQQLKIITTEMFNLEIDFKQTLHHDNCTYCSFKGICGR